MSELLVEIFFMHSFSWLVHLTDLLFLEVSALTGDLIEELFKKTAQKLLARWQEGDSIVEATELEGAAGVVNVGGGGSSSGGSSCAC